MSNVKIVPNLFLETAELSRIVKFLSVDGHKAEFLFHTKSVGLFNGLSYPGGYLQPTLNFKVNPDTATTVSILGGRAIDHFANIITKNDATILNVPNNDLWYWLKIAYRVRNEEPGTVDIDINGNLVGTGTSFLDTLRGQPNFPSKIKFTSSVSGNTYEYEVVNVIDNTNAVLSGVFNAESGLTYKVVGTFEPGYVVPGGDKFIFNYDDVEFTLVPESPSGSNIAPAKTDGEEFWLARLKSNGTNLIIEDKRTEFWQTHDEWETRFITRIQNPMIGVESVKWNLPTTFRDTNEINVAWGFRSTNWSVDTSTNKITINAGIGGILKENDVTFFTNGDFDNWRLYAINGKYSRIVSSQKIGTQLNLILDFLDIDNFTTGDELHMVPDVEEIEIISSYDSTQPPDMYFKQIQEKHVFPIHLSQGKIYLRIVDEITPYKYNLRFRYKSHRDYTNWFVFPDDSIGYYDESSFDDTGDLKPLLIDRTQKPYVGDATIGFIEIVPHPQNGRVILDILYNGDLPGIEYRAFTSLSLEYRTKVGVNRQYQIYTTDPAAASFASDVFIILEKTRADTTPCVNGNRFVFWMKKYLYLDPGVKLRFVTDYVNSITYTLIHELTTAELSFMNYSTYGLRKEFVYDGTNWRVDQVHELDQEGQGNITMFYGNPAGKFDGTGLGITGAWVGKAMCNGNNGTPDMRGRFPVGYYGVGGDAQAEYATIGELGPVDPGFPVFYTVVNNGKSIAIGMACMPTHNHTIDLQYQGDDSTGSAFHHYNRPGEGHDGVDTFTTSDTGAGLAHENRPPFFTVAYIIKL